MVRGLGWVQELQRERQVQRAKVRELVTVLLQESLEQKVRELELGSV